MDPMDSHPLRITQDSQQNNIKVVVARTLFQRSSDRNSHPPAARNGFHVARGGALLKGMKKMKFSMDIDN